MYLCRSGGMVDAAVSKTVARKGVTVRLCPSAPVKAYTQALNINPSDQLAYQYRGDSYKALGKIAAAQEDYKTAQELR